MNKPTIDELLRKVDGKYALAVAAAKRARLLTEEHGHKIGQTKAVSQALNEVASGKVKCVLNQPIDK